MYKKLLPLLTLLFILIATPVLANENSSDKPQNHGSFVSAEAHEHEGGAEVSAVAKSDIGKHNDDDEDENEDIDEDDDDEDFDDDDGIIILPSPSTSPSPTVEPSASPSPTVEPSASPSPSPTPSPAVEAGTEVTVNTNIIQGLIDQLKSLVASLENLLS